MEGVSLIHSLVDKELQESDLAEFKWEHTTMVYWLTAMVMEYRRISSACRCGAAPIAP